MTPDELRKLADEATGAAHGVHADGTMSYAPHLDQMRASSLRLIALAPHLARLCAELWTEVDELLDYAEAAELQIHVSRGVGVYEEPEWFAEVRVVLAKLAELNNGAEHPPGAERT